jgi:hypothetical protein
MLPNMRKFLIILLIIIHKIALCQLTDNFSDGDFTDNPSWNTSNNLDFIVINDELRSNSSIANSNFYISTSNTRAINTIWEFDCNLKFATSGANYVDIYLISNTDNLKSTNIQGYFVRIGNSDDEISLYRRSGTLASSIKIIDGTNGIVSNNNNNPFKIKVSRNFDGEFTLEWDKSQTGNTYQTEGKVVDNTYLTSTWFGIYIQQSTATFHQKHFFDNFIIKDLEQDTSPPVLLSFNVDAQKISLNFNEDIETTEAVNPTNYQITPNLNFDITFIKNTVILNLKEELETGNYNIIINNLKDLLGNSITPYIEKEFYYKKPYQLKPNDIVINEIFADPSPQIDLPTVEFIELWNTTEEDISLQGFKYKDASSTYTFHNDSIKAKEYLILCAKADTAEFKKFGRVIGISPWPSLNNASDALTLIDTNDIIQFQVNYNDTWYRDNQKKAGGYSLELIDPKSSCKTSQNYTASNDISGGTPGRQNSVYRSNLINQTQLKLLNVIVKDSVHLTLQFNKGLDSLQASNIENYFVNNGVGRPESIIIFGPDFSTVELKYSSSLTRNRNFTLTINDLSDCGFSVIQNQNFNFIYPGFIGKKDVLINEILFNPRPNGVDFVEVYNNSDKTLDFKDLRIGSLNDKDSVVNIRAISTKTLLFEPQKHWVITTNPENIKTEYITTAPENFITVTTLPSFNDDKGSVILLNTKNERVDQLNYDKDMHFALLKNAEGISLERSFINEETNKRGNFRSATSDVGYATPAYKNSQYMENPSSEETIKLSSPTFSPDNDGFEDILSISYLFKTSGFIANVNIFNDQGRLVKKLIRNESIYQQGNWIWEGLDDQNNLVKTGIYIIYIEVFDLNGTVKKFKKTIIVASKFY